MLAGTREMLEEVERVAGASRADSISERLAMLLPAQVQDRLPNFGLSHGCHGTQPNSL